jgi:DNA end-binding protein Ku
MARAVWSGSISFGLVNVPVKAYTAVRDHEVSFHQLEKETGSRIRYRKVSEKTGEEVDADDIELGYEIRKGEYVTFEKGEIDDLRPESTRAIDVSDFVPLEDIDPIYYERTYWLGPGDDNATKAYQLLLAAMEDRQRVGIGTVVMRNKQYLTAIRPLDGVLAMSTMRFADEVVPQSDIDELPSRRSKPDAKAVKLATQIVDSLATDWDPEKYEDTYTKELRTLIKRKDKGEDLVVEEKAEPRAKVLDLMEALEASVAEARSGRKGTGTSKRTAKKRATKRPAKKQAAKKQARKSA